MYLASVRIKPMSPIRLTPMSRRLLPLYVSALLQGIVFWYAIEKLFMLTIGFNTATIGLMVAIMSVVMLAVETPSGILADRWSRKGVMILGALALGISAAIGALSYSVPVYIASTVFWGIYAALYSGTYDSVLYDTTIEEHGSSEQFEKYLGRFRAVEGSAFVIGALLGSAIASVFSMRQTYIISLPFILLAVVFLWKFREPQLHKAEVSDPVFTHIGQTFAAVLRTPILLPVVVAMVGFTMLQEILLEISQLWFIAVATPLGLYGLFSASLFSSWALGGILAARVRSNLSSYILMSLILVSIVGLITTRNYWLVAAVQFVLAVSLIALGVILAKKLHDELPSKLRAGSASVVSTLARLLLIPSVLAFTAIGNTASIYSATYLLLGVAIVAIVAFSFIASVKPVVSKN